MGKSQISVLASENQNRLKGDLRRASLKSKAPVAISAFKTLVGDKARIAINMEPGEAKKALQDGFENAQKQIDKNAEDQPDSLEAFEDIFYKGPVLANRRLSFQSNFLKSESFISGSLYLDGPGAFGFGDCCLVLKRESVKKKLAALIAHDSLNSRYYTLGDQDLDMQKLRAELADFEFAGHLAALKHHRVLNANEAEWSQLLGKGENYIEAILAETIFFKDIDFMLVPSKYYDRWEPADLLVKDFSSAEAKLSRQYRDLLSLAKEKDIKIGKY